MITVSRSAIQRTAPWWPILLAVSLCLSAALPMQAQQINPHDYWETVWVNTPPSSPSHPNYWMNGGRRYTGLAYDKVNDVVYIVNPKRCSFGPSEYPCPEIHAWDAETGTVAHRIGNPAVATGQLEIKTNIVKGGYRDGDFCVYKIDVDDEGRIFACNVVAPIWGPCVPGPAPPN